MTTPTLECSLRDVEADEYEPFIIDGAAVGEVRWVRTEGAGGAPLRVGSWCSGPQSFPPVRDQWLIPDTMT